MNLSASPAPSNTAATAPDRRNVENIYPLSPMQQGLLFHALLAPGGSAYLPQVVLTLQGTIDPARLRHAWQRALERHPILRTGFHWEQRDEPFQVVYRSVDLLLLVRSRRTPEGWELHDLLASGLTQTAAAQTLGITPQAASQRARTAAIRTEITAMPALAGVLSRLDGGASQNGDEEVA